MHQLLKKTEAAKRTLNVFFIWVGGGGIDFEAGIREDHEGTLHAAVRSYQEEVFPMQGPGNLLDLYDLVIYVFGIFLQNDVLGRDIQPLRLLSHDCRLSHPESGWNPTGEENFLRPPLKIELRSSDQSLI